MPGGDLPAGALVRILVTGGAGFIGSRLVTRLARHASRVTVVDDLSAGLPLPDADAVVAPVAADIRDPQAMDAIFAEARPEVVVHLAAIHHIPTCTAEPRRALDVNVVGTQTVLDAAGRHGTRMAVIASSGAVYGWQDGSLKEDALLDPRDTYALGKLANEHQLAVWTRRTGARGRVARIFNAVGPGDPNAHLVPDVLRRLAAAVPAGDGAIRLPLGNTETRRDYVHVDDIADGLAILTCDADAASFAAYNLCTGRELSVRQLVERLAGLTGQTVRIERDPALVRPDDRPSQLGDPARTAERLGWRARRTVEDALALIVRAESRAR